MADSRDDLIAQLIDIEGYSDFETRTPEAWKIAQEEAERHNRFLDDLLGPMPDDPKTLGGPGSGNHGHAGRPGAIGGSAPQGVAGGGFATFRDAALENLKNTSRTALGISDTSTHEDKPKLRVEGDALVEKSAANFESALGLVWAQRERTFNDPEEVRAFTEEVASTVSDGLLAKGQGLYRTWPTPHKQTSPEFINDAMTSMSSELFQRIDAEDSIATAAWLEKELSEVHPWADGVGRTSKVLSAFVLARAGKKLPKYPDSKTYYKNIKKSPAEWESYYRSMLGD